MRSIAEIDGLMTPIGQALIMMLGDEQAGALIQQCLKATNQTDVTDLDEDLALVACLIMTGQQKLSSVAAISTAGTLRGRPSWQGLLDLGRAIISFSNSDPMAITTRQLVHEAVVEAHHTISVLIAEER